MILNGEKIFVPNVLLCGDREDFYSRIGGRPCKIVGQVEFASNAKGGEFNFLHDKKIALNGEIKDAAELAKFLRGGGVDYLVCTNLREWFALVYHDDLQKIGCPRAQVITPEQLKLRPTETFFDVDADAQLLNFLKTTPFKTVLDFNAHFAKGQLLTRGIVNDTTELDCIFDGTLPAIKENLYAHVYKSFADCAFRHYDAALVFEDAPIDFDSAFFTLENSADVVITFAKFGSAIKTHLRATLNNFAKVDVLPSFSGEWLICYRRTPPRDFAIYVATHKTLPAEHVAKLPAGYKLIHAGRALSTDLGYTGDNTGENISDLNAYINENTAIFWIWKNTSNTVVGLSHYRRFFTESADPSFAYEKILTEAAALRLLERYDIVVPVMYDKMTQAENFMAYCGADIAKFALAVVRKKITQLQPDYLDAFDFVMNSATFYNCNMFVTRRHVFNAYCTWLFSFFLEATREVLATTPLPVIQGYPKRLMGFFAERMLTVWLVKNRLRVRELHKMVMFDL